MEKIRKTKINAHLTQDNSKYNLNKEYEPEKSYTRELNEKEQYVIKETIINRKLEQENEEELLKANVLNNIESEDK